MSATTVKRIGWVSAAALVVANMVGTGAFTTLGLQLQAVQNTWSILLLWLLGGVVALMGAFSYAELGTHLPRSGGEFYFLSRLYHPFLGYLSGWVSLTVGFAAPIALSAMAMGAYLDRFVPLGEQSISLIAILLISLVHSYDIRHSSIFQNILTVFKVGLILFLAIGGLYYSGVDNAMDWTPGWREEIWQPGFAVALVYVTYSFSGWNAAAYIVEEIRRPSVNLPRALLIGTLLVSLLFVLLQMAMLNHAPVEKLVGKVEVGQVAAVALLGEVGGQAVSVGVAILMVSSISAMIWVGPRVTRAMAIEHPIWQFLAHDNRNGIPVRAIWLQSTLSIAMVLVSSFRELFLYSGFILQLFSAITVAGVFVLRKQKQKENSGAFRGPLYPVPQVIYLLVSIWILGFLLYDQPRESLWSLTNLLVGALSYGISHLFAKYNRRE